MFQTILGIVILLVGLAGVVFNRRLASAHRDFNRWALGLELSFAPDGGSGRHYFSEPGSPDYRAAYCGACSTGRLSGRDDQAEWLLHGALLKV